MTKTHDISSALAVQVEPAETTPREAAEELALVLLAGRITANWAIRAHAAVSADATAAQLREHWAGSNRLLFALFDQLERSGRTAVATIEALSPLA